MGYRHRVLLIAALMLSAAALRPPAATAQTAADFFDDATLDRLDLYVNSADWEKLKQNFRENDYYPADMEWRGIRVRNLGIRSRGFGSRSDRKPGLRVDFDRYSTSQEFLGLKSFVLDNLVQDPSAIKEALAMKVFARLGLPAPREAFVALYVNNTFAGLYARVESIDKSFLKRVFGEYEGDTENDGYLYEYNYLLESPYYFNYLGPDLEAYAPRFAPKTHEKEPLGATCGPLEAMIRTINEVSSQEFTRAVSEYLDLPLFARYLAAENFVAENDGILGYAGMNNFYLYRFEDRVVNGVDRGNLHEFLAWDKDNAFLSATFNIHERQQDNVLVRRMMENTPEAGNAYYDALLEAARIALEPTAVSPDSTDMPPWLAHEVDRLYSVIRDVALADTLKPFSNEDFEGTVGALRDFARRRPLFVRCEVARVRNAPDLNELCAAASGPTARR